MVNVPVLAVALTAGARLVLESRDPAPGRFDLVGAPASWPAAPAGRRAVCQARNPSRDTAVATWCELLKLPQTILKSPTSSPDPAARLIPAASLPAGSCYPAPATRG